MEKCGHSPSLFKVVAFMAQQRVLILGAGIVGLTTAWFLRNSGFDITVVDRQPGVGRETSFANGGLLTPSMSQPWNTPGCWRMLAESLVRTDSPLMVRWHSLPGLAAWGAQFLWHSRHGSFDKNTRSNLVLALHSMQKMQAGEIRSPDEFTNAIPGTLRLFRDKTSFDAARLSAGRLASLGAGSSTLSAAECIDLEPALTPIGPHLEGGILFTGDRAADALYYCRRLETDLIAAGVQFRFGVAASRLLADGGTITGIMTGQGELMADHIVVAAGSFSAPLLAALGIRVPVRPAKGYSVSIDTGNKVVLGVPLVDDHFHAVVTPLGSTIRVAGTAEFAGYDPSLDPARTRNLIGLLRNLLPDFAFDPEQTRSWAGLRAMSVDGVPLVGKTPVRNLWLNIGHGHLGWTMAAGSGSILADLICKRQPQVDAAPYAPDRFWRRAGDA
jgi:D-amino-acid dehydrogenase